MTTKHKYKFGETPEKVIRVQIGTQAYGVANFFHVEIPSHYLEADDILTVLDALVVAFECAVECSPVSSNSAAQGYHKLRIDILAALGIEEA